MEIGRIQEEIVAAEKAYAEATSEKDRLYWTTQLMCLEEDLKHAKEQVDFEWLLENMFLRGENDGEINR